VAQSQLKVSVQTQYLAEQSSAEDGVYTFAYFVTIENTGEIAAQVIARHWIIEDASGARQEVKGLGVVGQQPLIQPGASFSYNSAPGYLALSAVCMARISVLPMTPLFLRRRFRFLC